MADSKTNKNDKPVVKKPNKIQKWWNETVGELRKVTWPTKDEALKMTKIVTIVVVATAAFLGIVDFIFSRLVGLVLG